MHKRRNHNAAIKHGVKRKKPLPMDEEISSEEEEDEPTLFMDSDHEEDASTTSEHEEQEEEEEPLNEEEERVAVAKNFLNRVLAIEKENTKLENPLLQQTLHEMSSLHEDINLLIGKQIQQQIQQITFSSNFFKGHKQCITCSCTKKNFLYTASKDRCIIEWNLQTNAKRVIYKSETTPILSMCTSYDGKYLVFSHKSTTTTFFDIYIYDTLQHVLVHHFEKCHTKPVTGLVFRKGTYDLYSCSLDKSIKIWTLQEMMYLDVLFGHENDVWNMDSFIVGKCITCGGDSTVRIWKIEEESQLIYRYQTKDMILSNNIDCVSVLNENEFVTGAQDGHLTYWDSHSKKPRHIFANAHGGQWIYCLKSIPFTRMFLSGSTDGYVKCWNIDKQTNQIELIQQIPVQGCITGIEVNIIVKDEKIMMSIVVCVGNEHRLGRWNIPHTKVKNGILKLDCEMELPSDYFKQVALLQKKKEVKPINLKPITVKEVQPVQKKKIIDDETTKIPKKKNSNGNAKQMRKKAKKEDSFFM